MTRPLTVTRPCVTIPRRRGARRARRAPALWRCARRISSASARRARRAPVEFRLALAIGAAAAERRTFCENLAVVLVLATRPIGEAPCDRALAARMLLPVGAALGRVEGRILGDPTRGADRRICAAAFLPVAVTILAAGGQTSGGLHDRTSGDRSAACRNVARALRSSRVAEPRASAMAWICRAAAGRRNSCAAGQRTAVAEMSFTAFAARRTISAIEFGRSPRGVKSRFSPPHDQTAAGRPVAEFPIRETSFGAAFTALATRRTIAANFGRSPRSNFGRSPRGV